MGRPHVQRGCRTRESWHAGVAVLCGLPVRRLEARRRQRLACGGRRRRDAGGRGRIYRSRQGRRQQRGQCIADNEDNVAPVRARTRTYAACHAQRWRVAAAADVPPPPRVGDETFGHLGVASTGRGCNRIAEGTHRHTRGPARTLPRGTAPRVSSRAHTQTFLPSFLARAQVRAALVLFPPSRCVSLAHSPRFPTSRAATLLCGARARITASAWCWRPPRAWARRAPGRLRRAARRPPRPRRPRAWRPPPPAAC
jgi:hypothetical protein